MTVSIGIIIPFGMWRIRFALIGVKTKKTCHTTDIVSGRKIDMSRKTIEVDSGIIGLAIDELSRYISAR
jgi:hypothetical protein